MSLNETNFVTLSSNCQWMDNSSCISGDSPDLRTDDNVKISALTFTWCVVYGIISIAGLFGNGLVIFVILKHAKMKTVTNIYILNLSIADGLFLTGFPMVITTVVHHEWLFGFALCKVYYILTCINMFTGAFTLTAMSGDRFHAVWYPVKSLSYRKPKYASWVVALVWCLSLLLMLPVMVYAQMVIRPDGRYSCTIQWPNEDHSTASGQKIYILYTFLAGFAFPTGIICVLYTLVVIRLRMRNRLRHNRSNKKRKPHRTVTKLVSVIITVFIICWLPYWIFQVNLVTFSPNLNFIHVCIFHIFTLLTYANSMINPVLYAFTNKPFRNAFYSAFCCVPNNYLLSGHKLNHPIINIKQTPELRSKLTNSEISQANVTNMMNGDTFV